MPSPTYVPVVRTGVDVEFADVTVTGALDVTGAATFDGNVTVSGYTAIGAGQADGQWTLWSGDKDVLRLGTAGGGIAIKEGANATSGAATLVAGTVTVATDKVAANSRIQLTVQSLGTVTSPKAIGVTARVAGTSFTITSADATDTSVVAWQIVSPAA
ncbi:hypothetical protein [Streptomyces luteogriseus]|uniref:hypothetical protein n=1 Tax=Streptomyces luteogriseus TaxID=68233 RepID=UPI0026171B54|nr:hypothetical protein [uncultured Streptomyces sp.]